MTRPGPEGGLPPSSLAQLRLFPLPDTVLFPGTVLPLHVFEPRYRAMVQDALDGDRLFAVALLKPGFEEDYEGRPPIHPVVGVGRIVQVQKVRDGRYYLALQGVGRARVLSEEPPTKAWRCAAAVELVDNADDDADDVRAGVETLQSALVKLAGRMPDRAETFSSMLEEIRSPSQLADILCAAALESAEERQRALETTDVTVRLEMATSAVAELLLRGAPAGDDETLPS